MTKIRPIYISLLSLLLWLSTASCKVKLVADYDPQVYDQLVSTGKKIDKLYIGMLDTPAGERQYSKFRPEYTDIEVELNSLLDQSRLRYKNEAAIKQCENNLLTFKKYKKAHKDADALSDADIVLNMQFMKGLLNATMLAEGFRKNIK